MMSVVQKEGLPISYFKKPLNLPKYIKAIVNVFRFGLLMGWAMRL